MQGQLRTLESNFNTSFTKIEGLAKGVGGQLASAFGVGLSIAGIVSFGKSVVDLGDKLSDLHDQTGISIEILGGIKPVLDSSNSSLEGFAKGFAKAQRSLGDFNGAGKEAAQALKAIGLDAKQVAESTPDQALEKIVTGLAKVTNVNERAAIAARLFGKSAAELIPTILNLAENGIPKLDNATAKAYEDLGKFKDQITLITAALTNLAAVPIANLINFFKFITGNLTPREQTVNQLDELSDRGLKIAAQIRQAQSLRSQGVTTGIASDSVYNGMLAERDKILGQISDTTAKLPPKAKAAGEAFKGLLPNTAEVDKLQNALNSFFEGLNKQLDSVKTKTTGSLFGPQAELGAQLDAQLDEFKKRLTGDKLPIPKGLDESFNKVRDAILGANLALTQLNESLEETTKRQQAFADAANEGVGIEASSTTAQQAAALKTAQNSVDDLRTQLRIDAIDTSTPAGAEQKRQTEIVVEFQKSMKQIEEFGRQAQLSETDSAELTSLAWKKATNALKNDTDELTKFQERAFEKIQDFLSGGINDILSGNVKSWKDWGLSIKKVIDGLVSEFLALQLKTALFGKNFGASSGGGNVGGLFGSLGSLFSSGASSPVGYGARPAGMEGPAMANGGFFSSAGGWLSSLFSIGASVLHEGGMPGGSPTRSISPALFTYAPRYHQGIDFAGGEMPAILKRGEEVGWPDKLAEKYGGRSGPTTINIINPNFADRRSAGQVYAKFGATVDMGKRNR